MGRDFSSCRFVEYPTEVTHILEEGFAEIWYLASQFMHLIDTIDREIRIILAIIIRGHQSVVKVVSHESSNSGFLVHGLVDISGPFLNDTPFQSQSRATVFQKRDDRVPLPDFAKDSSHTSLQGSKASSGPYKGGQSLMSMLCSLLVSVADEVAHGSTTQSAAPKLQRRLLEMMQNRRQPP